MRYSNPLIVRFIAQVGTFLKTGVAVALQILCISTTLNKRDYSQMGVTIWNFHICMLTYHPAEALSTFIFNRHSLFSIIIFCLFLPIFSRKDSFFCSISIDKVRGFIDIIPCKIYNRFIIVFNSERIFHEKITPRKSASRDDYSRRCL